MVITPERWATLKPKDAAKLVGCASQVEQRFAARFNDTGAEEDEALWRRAFALWENLNVLAKCGYRARDPYVVEND